MTEASATAVQTPRIARNTPEFHRVAWGLGSGGFAIFALLYCVQPVLPAFTLEFGVTPAQSSLALSTSTILMAIGMIVSAPLSERIGRRAIMIAALFGSAVATILLGLATSWWQVLALRSVLGIALSGLPAVAMAYLADELEPDGVGLAMGLYIGANAMGGMLGRFAFAALADLASWRVGVVAMGGFGLASMVVFWWALPPSRNFRPNRSGLGGLLKGFVQESRDPGLRILVVEAFLLLGAFVMLFNYISFRLQAPPFGLSQTAVGAIFLVYLLGSLGSAWMGSLASRFGRRVVFPVGLALFTIGLLLTLPDNLIAIGVGMALITFGFFGAHSVASSWVGLRASPRGRAQASSLYLMCYYLGSSFIGWLGGFFWTWGLWPAVVGLGLAMMMIAFLGAAQLARVPSRPAQS